MDEPKSHNPGNIPAAPGHFSEMDDGWLDFLEARLIEGEETTFESHLQVCGACRASTEEWRRLDLVLARTITPPKLSPAFNARLWQAIEKHAAAVGTRSLSERLNIARDEAQAVWEQERRRFFRKHIPHFLDFLGYGTLAALAWLLLLRIVEAAVPAGMHTAGPNGVNPVALIMSMAAGLLFLGGTVGFILRAQLRRWAALG